MPDQPAPDFEEARRILEQHGVVVARGIDGLRTRRAWLNSRETAVVLDALRVLLSEREAREEVIEAAAWVRGDSKQAIGMEDPFGSQGPPIIVGANAWFKLADTLEALPATESAQAEQPPDRNSGHSPEEVVEQPTSEAGS